MKRHTTTVTMNGSPLTVVGDEVKVGDKAPDCTLVDNDLKSVRLSSLRGKTCIIASVPSLDTPVCDMETRRFNGAASSLGEGFVVVTISMDLPFAQKRWCGSTGVDRVITLSDHRDAEFGRKYGLLIEKLRLLARAVLVVDARGVVRYRELVPEVTHEPNYNAAIAAARQFG